MFENAPEQPTCARSLNAPLSQPKVISIPLVLFGADGSLRFKLLARLPDALTVLSLANGSVAVDLDTVPVMPLQPIVGADLPYVTVEAVRNVPQGTLRLWFEATEQPAADMVPEPDRVMPVPEESSAIRHPVAGAKLLMAT